MCQVLETKTMLVSTVIFGMRLLCAGELYVFDQRVAPSSGYGAVRRAGEPERCLAERPRFRPK